MSVYSLELKNPTSEEEDGRLSLGFKTEVRRYAKKYEKGSIEQA